MQHGVKPWCALHSALSTLPKVTFSDALKAWLSRALWWWRLANWKLATTMLPSIAVASPSFVALGRIAQGCSVRWHRDLARQWHPWGGGPSTTPPLGLWKTHSAARPGFGIETDISPGNSSGTSPAHTRNHWSQLILEQVHCHLKRQSECRDCLAIPQGDQTRQPSSFGHLEWQNLIN